MDHKDVEILAHETVYKGYFQIDRYRLRHRRHQGGWTGEITREVLNEVMSRRSSLTIPIAMPSS